MDKQGGLRALLRRCLVRIDADDYGRGGSGFFVSPNRVLTCAHVVGEMSGRPVSGIWQGQRWSGIVEYASPLAEVDSDHRPTVRAPSDDEGGIWPPPDLAVIRLDVSLNHPCVRLSGRNATEGGGMAAVGWCHNLGRLSYFSVDLHYPGPAGPDEDRQLLRLVGDRLEPGMSGAPLLDLSTGEVCGVLKLALSAQEGYAASIGYLRTALPVEVRLALWRDHDIYHAQEREWTRAQDQLWLARSARSGGPWSWAPLDVPPPLLRPVDEVELLGLLARLPDPLEPAELCRECLSVEPSPEPVDLLDLREAVFWLADRMHEPGELHPVYVCAEILAERAPPELRLRLREWSVGVVTRVSGNREQLMAWRERRSRRTVRPDSADINSVIVRVRPSPNNPQEHEVTIWLYRSRTDIQLVHQDEVPRPLDEIWEWLRISMRSVLGMLQGANTLVEMVLPPYLFDTAFDQWELSRRVSWSQHQATAQDCGYVVKLGYRHPVVVRDLERFDDIDEESRNHARPRWAWLRDQRNGIPVQWMHCEQRASDALYRWFESSEEHAALGLPGPACEEPGRYLLDLAIAAGVPVALWRRQPCQDHNSAGPQPQPCSGELFQRRTDSALVGQHLMELPGWIRKRRVGAGPGPGPHATHSPNYRHVKNSENNEQEDDETVLFWDDPNRVPPFEPLVALRSDRGEPR